MTRPSPDNFRARIFRRLLAMLLFGMVASFPAAAQDSRITGKATRQVHCMGQTYKLPVRTTSLDGEVMVKADEPALMLIARALGRDLTWNGNTLKLAGDAGMTLGLGQTTIGEQNLPIAPTMIDNSVYVPISALETLLTCQVAAKGGKSAIYVEPTIRSISFDDDGSNGATLHILTTVPVRKKVFKLANPSRTVIDLIGVAMPTKNPSFTHPVLGEIRVAQNQPAPSVTRIVIPTPDGVKVLTPKSFDLFEHKAEVTWKKGQAVATAPVTTRPTPAPPVRTTTPSTTIKIPTSPPRVPVVVVAETDEDPDNRQEPTVSVPASTQSSKRPLLLKASWEGVQLKLVFSQPVTYRWSRLSAGQHRYIVDFPGVIFPDKRQTLNSSIPGLQAVRIVQNMPEPSPVVRLVCDLDGPIAVNTMAGEETELMLEFPGRSVAGGGVKGAGQTEKPKPGSASGRTICLDAGHGGSDPGALNRTYNVSEKQVTLDITLRLATMLKAEGWNVVLTRSIDRDVSYAGSTDKEELGARSGVANEQGADIFVSIHCNSAANTSVGGTSIHWFKADDYTLAKSLESEVLVATGRTHRGLIKDRFFVLAHTQMPAVLIETAFISNNQEGQLLASPDYRDRIARGIAAGLRGYAAKNFPLSAAGK